MPASLAFSCHSCGSLCRPAELGHCHSCGCVVCPYCRRLVANVLLCDVCAELAAMADPTLAPAGQARPSHLFPGETIQ